MAELFPRTLYPRLRFIRTSDTNVARTPLSSGKSLGISRWPSDFDKWTFRGDRRNTNTNIALLSDFWYLVNGPSTEFDFFDPVLWVWGYQISMGTGTAALTYDAPGDTITGETVYLNGVAQSSPADYSLSAGTGKNGRDQVVFTGSVSGQAITIKFTGYRCFTARFINESLPFTHDLPFGGTAGPFEIEGY